MRFFLLSIGNALTSPRQSGRWMASVNQIDAFRRFRKAEATDNEEKKLLLSELKGGGTYFGHSIDYCLQLVLSLLLSTNQLTRIDSFFFNSFLIKIIFSFQLLNNKKK